MKRFLLVLLVLLIGYGAAEACHKRLLRSRGERHGGLLHRLFHRHDSRERAPEQIRCCPTEVKPQSGVPVKAK